MNGKKIVEHEGSFVPFEAELTDLLQANGNKLQVDVEANTISDILACTSQYAAHNVAGILRKVTLFVLPKTHISDITLHTVFDQKYINAELKLDTSIAFETNKDENLELKYSLSNGKKKVIEKVFPVNGSRTLSTILIKKPRQWNPESPFLYDFTTTLLKNGMAIQVNKQRIGVRQIEIKGAIVYVNGKPIKLHGVNRHVTHPLTGRSISPMLARKDAELFKKANCNFIRTSHYPPSEEFLDAADEIGLFVESEASLTWIEHHASPIWGTWDYKDKRFLPYLLHANIENIKANKHHPSIILWSLGNESGWSPLWDKVNKAVKIIDPSRPTAFHDQGWGGFNNKGSIADISNIHYTDLNGPAYIDKTKKRPTLIGEYAHLSTYNRRELLTDPGVRDAYNKPLVKFYDSIYYHKKTLGGAIWSGIDDTFHLPDGRIVGYGPWGPIDGWRREKPEYFGVKKAYTPIKVKEIKKMKGQLVLKVENRFDFTPLSKVKIVAYLNGKAQKVRSKILPRKSGIIKIPYGKNIDDARIIFYGPNGNIVEEEYVNYKVEPATAIIKMMPLSYTENKESYLVKQGSITYRVSKNFGNIVSVKKDNKTILNEGPRFTLIPRNSENGGKEHIAGETYQRVIHPIQSFPWYMKYATNIVLKEIDNSIQISMNITYNKGNGTIKYIFNSRGQFITKYDVEQTNENSSPYQYGLVLQLPKRFDELKWKRQGDFTVYPKSHIGRNSGVAKLNARTTTGVEPWREKPTHLWNEDANELGSNDFKSSKRHILKASLSDNNGRIVEVISKGNQTSRTWLQEEYVNWLIADYSNNGSEPFYGAPHTDGRIKTKGMRLKGTLVLTIK